MKFEVYSTPEMLKNHQLGVKAFLPGGRTMDYGVMNFGRDYHRIITKEVPKLAKSFDEPVEWTTNVIEGRESIGSKRSSKPRDYANSAKRKQEDLLYAVTSGNYNDVFGVDDPNNVRFIPLKDEGPDGKRRFAPVHEKHQQEMFDFNADYWKLSPEEYAYKMDEYRAGLGPVPLGGIGARDYSSPLDKKRASDGRRGESNYESVLLADGGMTPEEKAEFIEGLPPEARKAYEKLAANKRWVMKDGKLVIDMDTGRGHNAAGIKRPLGTEARARLKKRNKESWLKEAQRQYGEVVDTAELSADDLAKNNVRLNEALGKKAGGDSELAQQMHDVSKMNKGYNSFLSGLKAGLKNNPQMFGFDTPMEIDKEVIRQIMPKDKYFEVFKAGGNDAARNMVLGQLKLDDDKQTQKDILEGVAGTL